MVMVAGFDVRNDLFRATSRKISAGIQNMSTHTTAGVTGYTKEMNAFDCHQILTPVAVNIHTSAIENHAMVLFVYNEL